MKPIERIAMYLHFKSITPHAFEKKIKLSNGYFSKQFRNKGSVGSDILIKIHELYKDIDIMWVLTGEGQMLKDISSAINNNISSQVDEFSYKYEADSKKFKNLEDDLEKLNTAVRDKEKIISLYEFMINNNSSSGQSQVANII